MRVTDEMVRRLSDHLIQKLFYGSLNVEARDTRAREFLEVALSHAAGQDGEQCRASSVEDSAVNAVLTTIRRERDAWLSWNHDHPEQAAVTTPDVLEMAANLIRALSRGVPEGK